MVPNMKTLGVIFLLALIAIAGEIYSDAVLTRGQVSPGARDPASLAAAHGVKPG
jgi:hypothetical protein